MNPVRVPLFVPLVVLPAAAVFAQGVRSAANDASPEVLAPFTVASPRVANQEPAGTFTMPVSALRFEPRVDVQARNFAEGQADVAIRGGIFENTGFRVGALPLYDPQTGHYFAEIPVSAAMLGAPQVLTGADQARGGWNATAGSIAYGWRPVRTGGLVALSAGEYDSHREELYAGYASDHRVAGQRVAADVAVAHSESDGTIAYGDHDFTRYNARLQLAGEGTQTDLFAGYQSKFFGWPNLYTPFNALESENLQTTLVALNHRAAFGADGDYVQAGAYYRRNRDDYDFNRVTEAGKDALFQHTTWVYGASLDGRVSVAPDLAVGYRAGVVTDELKSTSLTFGRFRTRTHVSAGVYPEKRFDLGSGRAVVVTAGAGYDDTNRDGSAV
ncbi:MAG TPA: TonB-dependent receptor, partial [Opitutaceae bacterium]